MHLAQASGPKDTAQPYQITSLVHRNHKKLQLHYNNNKYKNQYIILSFGL